MGYIDSAHVLSFRVALRYAYLEFVCFLEIVLTIRQSSYLEENTFALKRYENSLLCNICTF